MSFERLFHPRGVAIIGASADPSRIGGHPLKALVKAGYKGGLYPVNPKYPELAGFTCYPDAKSIKGACDLAVVAVPAPMVSAAIRDVAAAGISYAVILTAGFRETGGDGINLETELKKTLAETGVRAIGPNCQGMLSVPARVWAAFGSVSEETDLRLGEVSGAFQSGGFGYAIINLAELQGVGFRYCVSTGNETDVTMPELLSAFLDDDGTKLAFGYMEGTPDARSLLDLGRKSLETGKPVLLWKGGITETGAKAAASHTANMTGRADLYRAAFRQAGIVEVDDVEPIVDIAAIIKHGRLPRGPNVGVLSVSGGSGVVFADRAVEEGLALPPFSDETMRKLRDIVPAFGSAANPADVTAGVFNNLKLITSTLDIVLEDPGIDQLVVLLASVPGDPALKAAEAIISASKRSDKPVLLAWSGRKSRSEAAWKLLEDARIPFITTPARLAKAMAAVTRFALDRERLLGRKMPAPLPYKGQPLPDSAVSLSESESKELLRSYGVAVTKEIVVPEGKDVVAAATAAGLAYPLAVKVVSRDIAHKTEVGGVKLGIADASALAAAAGEVIANARKAKPKAAIEGVLLAEMAEGTEVLIGVINDPGFGPTVAVGMGGVLTEILKDVTYRIAPFDIETARDMIGELRAARILDGYRGKPAADKEALAEMLATVSRMAAGLGDRLSEMDLNPVFVGPRGSGAKAADALVVLK